MWITDITIELKRYKYKDRFCQTAYASGELRKFTFLLTWFAQNYVFLIAYLVIAQNFESSTKVLAEAIKREWKNYKISDIWTASLFE
jgi:hypothetical protein